MKRVGLIIVLFIFSTLTAYTQSFDYSGFGEEMTILKSMEMGRCMDAAIYDERLFVIANRSLYVFDIDNARNPVVIDSVSNLGNVRQIEIQDGYAYITSREDGMFVVDVKDVRNMKKLAHYDSVELATGLHISGKMGAIANRIYGIELLDVSNPAQPRHVSSALTGEAQSLFIYKNHLYVGDWGTHKLIIFDISHPENPRRVSEFLLDGFGDGIFVRGDLCFVATGHHGAGLVEKKTTDPAWGAGHGLEIIDVKDPDVPRRRSMLKFPRYYQRSPDWWDVQVIGNYAFVGDTKAGLFVADVRNPDNPKFKGYVRLPEMVFGNETINDPVNGFTVGKSTLYIAGTKGLYVVDAPYIPKKAGVVTEKTSVFFNKETANSNSTSAYHTGTQIYSVCLDTLSKSAYLAAGVGGVHQVSLPPNVTGRQLINTGSPVYDLQTYGGKIFVAEGKGGLSVWELDSKDTPKLISQYLPPDGGVYQVVIDEVSQRAALHVGVILLDIVDISNPSEIKRIFTDRNLGPLYRFPITKQFDPTGAIGGLWLVDCYTYNIRTVPEKPGKKKELLPLGASNPSLGPINGFAFMENGLVATYGEELLFKKKHNNADTLIQRRLANSPEPLRGKVTRFNSTIYITNRREGEISAVDISNSDSPVLLWKNKIKGHPGYALEYRDMVIVPTGYGGLQIFQKQTGGAVF